MLFLALTLWLVLPALAPEHAPPAPASLFIGVGVKQGDGYDGTEPGSLLKLDIHAAGCSNPVTLDGTLTVSEHAWMASAPSSAVVTLVGATIASAHVGLGGIEAFPASQHGWGYPQDGREAMVEGNGYLVPESRLGTSFAEAPNPVAVHDHFSGLRVESGAAGAVLTAPQWPEARVPLHFTLKADLMHVLGFHRCYIDVPAVFPEAPEENEDSPVAPTPIGPWLGGAAPTRYGVAREFAEHLASPVILSGLSVGPRFDGSQLEAVRADVSVSVSGHIAEIGSIAGSGHATLTGATYECRASRETASPSGDCAGMPVFEALGVSADITRRLFLAGILGALAATLLVEALFLGETERRPR